MHHDMVLIHVDHHFRFFFSTLNGQPITAGRQIGVMMLKPMRGITKRCTRGYRATKASRGGRYGGSWCPLKIWRVVNNWNRPSRDNMKNPVSPLSKWTKEWIGKLQLSKSSTWISWCRLVQIGANTATASAHNISMRGASWAATRFNINSILLIFWKTQHRFFMFYQ